MNLQEFTELCRSSSVRLAAIVHRGEHWEIWSHTGPNRVDSGSDLITRFSTLLDAYQAIRTAGYVGTVEVDEVV